MEYDNLMGLMELLKVCSDIEQSPLGDKNPDRRVEELFMEDLLKLYVALGFASGDMHRSEIKFINKELKYSFNETTLNTYFAREIKPVEEFVTKVPVSFQYFLEAEFVRGRKVYNIYRGSCRKYIATIRRVGQEFIAVDGIVDQEEIDALNTYCNTLEAEMHDYKSVDLYQRYGRRKVSMTEDADKPLDVKSGEVSISDMMEYDKAKKKPLGVSDDRIDAGQRDAEEKRDRDDGLMRNNADEERRSGISSGGAAYETQGTKDVQTLEAVIKDINGIGNVNANPELDKLLKELNDMTGLQTVKDQVQSIINKINISKLRVEQGLDPLDVSMHMVFTGNPGTGKTTVARLLAKIFLAMGILSKGQLIETDRAGLVAGYMGQTAEKVNGVIEQAMGGILFIDEAYSLSNGNKEDFGQEAIDTLVKGMEDHREDLIVIVAGYKNEMKHFINANPGLQSRFTTYIDFEDYSAFELVTILIGMLSKKQYIIAPDAVKYVYGIFDDYVTGKHKNFGNARDVRNYCQKLIDRQIDRITSEGVKDRVDLVTIRIADCQAVKFAEGIE